MPRYLDTPCESCGEPALVVTADAAAHDDQTIEILIDCFKDRGGCGRVLNAFVPLTDFISVEWTGNDWKPKS